VNPVMTPSRRRRSTLLYAVALETPARVASSFIESRPSATSSLTSVASTASSWTSSATPAS